MTDLEAEVLVLVAAMTPGSRAPGLDDTFTDLGYTSLRFLELSIAVERGFGLPPLTPEMLAGVVTVRDLTTLVHEQRNSL